MSTKYLCLRGDGASETALDLPRSFALQDGQGREWFCTEPRRGSDPQALAAAAYNAVSEVQTRMVKQGFPLGESAIVILWARDMEELQRQLTAESPALPAADVGEDWD